MNRSERMYREMMMSGRSMGVRHRLPWRVRRVLEAVAVVAVQAALGLLIGWAVVGGLGLL